MSTPRRTRPHHTAGLLAFSALALGSLLAACGGGQGGAGGTAAGAKGSSATTTTTSEVPTMRALAVVTSLPISLPKLADPMLDGLAIPADAQTRGMWSAVQAWPMNAIHASVLPNGKVLSYGAPQNADAQDGRTFDVWTPSAGFGTGSHATSFDAARLNSFCGSAVFLSDGRLMLNSGNSPLSSHLFAYTSGTSTPVPAQLADERWYSTMVALPDGRAVVVGGMNPYSEGMQADPNAAVQNGLASMTPEVYTPGVGWRSLSGATSREAWGPDFLRASYPRAWLAPNGQVFGISAESMWYLDPAANNGLGATRIPGKFKSAPGPANVVNVGATNTAVMFAPGRILVAGGNGSFNGDGWPASNLATVVDINGANPVLTETTRMNFPRRFPNSVVLPNGQVVVTGGTRVGNNGGTDAVMEAEIWNPASNTWSVGASAARVRVYHSSTLLLPNGTVLSVGGGTPGPVFNNNAEVYYPPYLFSRVNNVTQLAARPVFTGISALGFAHGGSGQVEMETTAAVARLVLVANTVTTHSFNSGQRFIPLSFTQAGDRLSFTLPEVNQAPPGYYQLYALDANGVPSKGTIIAVGQGVSPPPNPGPVGGGVTGTGSGLLGSYYGTNDLSGNVLLERVEAVNFAFGLGAPATGLPADNFSARWVGEVQASTGGSYQFQTVSDDGVRLWVNGQLVIDNWTIHPATTNSSGIVSLTAGQRVAIKLEFQEVGGEAVIKLNWLPPGAADFSAIPASQLYAPANGGSPALSASPPGMASDCAAENASCTLPAGATARVWYGAGSTWVARVGLTGTVACNNATFGDPLPGVVKGCRYLVTALPSTGTTCASEGGNCVLPAGATATVWFGAAGAWATKTAQSGTVACTVANFGDPAPGVGKTCSLVVTGTAPAPLPTLGSITAPAIGAGSTASWAPNLDANGLTFSWDYGDGSPASAFVASSAGSHVYANPGVYTVGLTVRTAGGATASKFFAQAVYAARTPGQARASSTVVLEPRANASTRLWVVNADNDSVSVFDTSTNARVAEVPTGAGPRSIALASDGKLWVANRDAATLSLINPATLAVAGTVALPRASQPWGVVIGSDGNAYVSLQATGQVLKLNGTTGATLATATVPGQPRHLSVTGDGARLLVSRFITATVPGEATAVVNTAAGAAEVVVLNTGTMAVQSTVALRHSDKSDTEIQGGGIPNYLGAAVVSPDGSGAWVPGKQDNIRRGTLRNQQALNFQNTVRAISARIDLANLSENLALRADHDNASLASAATFDANGAYLFVALETARQVAVLNARTGSQLLRIEAGLAPQGVVVSADNTRLYVHNFMGRSVNVVDISPLTRNGEFSSANLATLTTVATDKLNPIVLKGKQLFYDARDTRLARDSYMSCATCHNEGGHDGRVWDLTHAGEGLRNTISLRGRAAAQGRLHWSANFDEVQDFEGQIRTLAGGTGLMSDAAFNTGTRNQPLGDKKAGVSADLDALAAYVGSLNSFDPSPLRQANGSLSTAAVAGRTVFAAQCIACHGGADFTNSADGQLRNVGTLKPGSGQRLGAALTGIDPPTLRDVWATAPYLHDGSAAQIEDAVRAHTNLTLSAADLASVSAFVRQIGSEEAAVTAPTPTPTFRTSAVFGPATGTAFTDPVASGQQMTGVSVRHWPDIYWLQGLATPANLPAHGGSGGTLASVTLPTGQYFVRLFGRYNANGIVRLGIATNTGVVYGPGGNDTSPATSTAFDFTVPAGSRIVGFTGRASATQLTAIGVLYTP